jgi:hypothetical protein
LLDKKTEQLIIQLLKRINVMLSIERYSDKTDPVMAIVEKLPPLEQEIIMRTYLSPEADYIRQYTIYRDMGISFTEYNELLLKSLHTLGIEFGVIENGIKE